MAPAEALTLKLLLPTPSSILRLPSFNPTRAIRSFRCSRPPIGKLAASSDPALPSSSSAFHFPVDLDAPGRTPEATVNIIYRMRARGLVLDPEITSKVMLWNARNGNFASARELWDEIINSSFRPDAELIVCLMEAYVNMGRPEEAFGVLRTVVSREFGFGPELFSPAVSCFGMAGELELMECVLKEMSSNGIKVDSFTANSLVECYGTFGTIEEMEFAYERLKKKWSVLIEEKAIRAMSLAYLREGKMYKLGEFLKGVGLRRRNVGNLLWNLLLLSYAVNFKMKSLQREFIGMVEAGFSPCLTTFNIRMLAFCRMRMFWDLHLSIEHMKHEGVVPDLVTYGCIVDAYLDRRLGRNLSFALDKMATNMEVTPCISTDPVVFEAFGKGDFHMFSEILLESTRRTWTYGKLIKVYLKRTYRSHQIFWNY